MPIQDNKAIFLIGYCMIMSKLELIDEQVINYYLPVVN